MNHRPRQPCVLVIDKDAELLRPMASDLRRQGYDVCIATSVEEGLCHLRQGEFDCVLIDHDLEQASRGQLVDELRRYPPQTVALILMAEGCEMPPGEVLLQSGAYDCLAKPFTRAALRIVVGRAIERATLARTMRELLEELDTANAQLRHAAAELQQQVDAATGELRRKVQELERTRNQLEAAHHQREEFVRLIAHELGGPLTVVEGYADMLGDPDLSGEVQQERAREVIASEARRMARLIDDLVESARRSGGFRLKLGVCDLAQIVRDQVEMARIHSGGHEITCQVPARPVHILGDRDRLCQVVSNLLSNALKYAGESNRCPIDVPLRRDGQQAQLRVIDHGPGIPAKRLDSIFEPNVRLARVDVPGRGLGLYVARSIVEAHHGRIWAEPTPGGGATFGIALPLRRSRLTQRGLKRARRTRRVGSRSHAR